VKDSASPACLEDEPKGTGGRRHLGQPEIAETVDQRTKLEPPVIPANLQAYLIAARPSLITAGREIILQFQFITSRSFARAIRGSDSPSELDILSDRNTMRCAFTPWVFSLGGFAMGAAQKGLARLVVVTIGLLGGSFEIWAEDTAPTISRPEASCNDDAVREW
jgi:hypothetical protein